MPRCNASAILLGTLRTYAVDNTTRHVLAWCEFDASVEAAKLPPDGNTQEPKSKNAPNQRIPSVEPERSVSADIVDGRIFANTCCHLHTLLYAAARIFLAAVFC